MISLARKAVQNGYRALFIKAQDLLDEMYASLANPALTMALLSRLRERCHTITIDGPCIRPQTR